VKNATAGLVLLVVLNAPMGADEPLSVEAVLTTAPLFNYEDAPATPDADGPAIRVNRRHPAGSLVIGTAKDAGLLVYVDMQDALDALER
jgi:3-phytase